MYIVKGSATHLYIWYLLPSQQHLCINSINVYSCGNNMCCRFHVLHVWQDMCGLHSSLHSISCLDAFDSQRWLHNHWPIQYLRYRFFTVEHIHTRKSHQRSTRRYYWFRDNGHSLHCN